MKSKKKLLTAVLSTALVAVVAVGTTFAYLTANSGEIRNAFSFSDNIRGELTEPNWDEDTSGKDLAPGQTIWKDPMITNTSANGLDEYAAIRVVFRDGDGDVLSDKDATRLLGLLEIDWNDSWKLIDGEQDKTASQIYAYDAELTPGQVSEPLFNSVTIKGDIKDEDMSWLAGIVLSHTPECWKPGEHVDGAQDTDGNPLCEVTYKHHINCAIADEADASSVAGGQEAENGEKCNCKPVEVHESTCKIYTDMKTECTEHTAEDTIGGFEIMNYGAVIQANQFEEGVESQEAVKAFKTLFGIEDEEDETV